MDQSISNDVQILCQYLTEHGAELYLVGGMPRDYKLYGWTPKLDYDIEIYNIELENLINLIEAKKYNYKIQGNFGVIKFLDFDIELAIPRRENKIGVKHTDFLVNLEPYMKIEEAIIRRDFHINTIMYNISKKEFYITNEAEIDLQKRQLRHVSSKFSEDPLRIIRAIRFSIVHDLVINPDTYNLCQQLTKELNTISNERIKQEFKKILKGKALNSRKDYLDLYFIDCLKLKKEVDIVFSDNYYLNIYLLTKMYQSASIKQIFSKNDFKYVSLFKKLEELRNNVNETLYAISPVSDFENELIDLFLNYYNFSNDDIIRIFELIERISLLKKEYNGSYFINQGITGKLIPEAQKRFILDLL